MQPTNEVIIDIEEYFRNDQRHPEHDPGVVILYRLKIDASYFTVKHRHLLGSAILELDNKNPEHWEVFQIWKEEGHIVERHIKPEEKVDLGAYGIERFVTKVREYCFSIDKAEYETKHSKLKVRVILEDFAKVSPDTKTLAVKTEDGFHEYKDLDEEVPLQHCPHFTLFDNQPTGVSCL
jgi:Multiubiquitin